MTSTEGIRAYLVLRADPVATGVQVGGRPSCTVGGLVLFRKGSWEPSPVPFAHSQSRARC